MIETVEQTEVAYHGDGFRPARPAINVKHYGPFADGAGRDLIEKLEAEFGRQWVEGRGGYDGALAAATEDASRQWWEDAAEAAKGYGLGEIEQEGRSGGWLVFADGRDPQDMAPVDECATCGDPEDTALHDEHCTFGAGHEHHAFVALENTERREWLAGYRKMVEWCRATINGGEVPAHRDTQPYTAEELAADPDVANVGPYHSDGIDADILYRLEDYAAIEREQRPVREHEARYRVLIEAGGILEQGDEFSQRVARDLATVVKGGRF